MINIKKTIWLNDNRNTRLRNAGDDFLVTKMKNSTRFNIGTYITEAMVNSLIRERWDVNIKENLGGII